MRNDNADSAVIKKIITVLIIIVAIIFIANVITLYLTADDRLKDIDSSVEVFASHNAKSEFMKTFTAYSKVYDAETKEFVDKKKAAGTVKPYGMSRENQGKYILVTVDYKGNVSTSWIYPGD